MVDRCGLIEAIEYLHESDNYLNLGISELSREKRHFKASEKSPFRSSGGLIYTWGWVNKKSRCLELRKIPPNYGDLGDQEVLFVTPRHNMVTLEVCHRRELDYGPFNITAFFEDPHNIAEEEVELFFTAVGSFIDYVLLVYRCILDINSRHRVGLLSKNSA